MALNILSNFEFDLGDRESVETFHKHWEAMKLAYSDALAHITDPKCMQMDFREWLSADYGRRRAKEISETAAYPKAERPPKGGTVYLCTADREGNMVSYIQSGYMEFGSGVVVRGTGISLQNRGCDFSLDKNAPNALGPGKKCYHTIIPGFLTKDGKALGPFGVMGGYMQPQGHLQVVTNLVDFGLNPQQALDAPRWQWLKGKTFIVEQGFSADIAKALARRGHEVSVSLDTSLFGRGQIILCGGNGVLVGATESRTDSNIACW
jgi:gamma-glutamyltranspeptidase/glutathione hydrolase